MLRPEFLKHNYEISTMSSSTNRKINFPDKHGSYCPQDRINTSKEISDLIQVDITKDSLYGAG